MRNKRNKFGMNNGTACNVGGSALMEGVMMKGPGAVAMAVRKSDGGMAIIKRPADQKGTRKKISKIPFVRGAYGIFDSMVDGVRYLMKSAEFVDLEDGVDSGKEPGKFEKWLERKFGDKLIDIMLYISVGISLIFSIGIFMLLPKFIVDILGAGGNKNLLKNVIEGAVRLIIFFGYIVGVSRLKDIKRVFAYHGAEHKSIHCLEHGEELTVENVRKYTTLHPRCGTAFLFLVMLISVLIYSVMDYFLKKIGLGNAVLLYLARLLCMPLIAGLSYEVTRFSARSKWKFVKILNAPGLALQYFTTNEPDDSMIEIGIASLKAVIDETVPFTSKEEEEAMIKASQGLNKCKDESEAQA